MKCLVTGGAGFIGSHLVDRLITEGNEVKIIDNLSSGKKENINPKADFYNLDICSPKISQIFKEERPEIVFHYAAQIDVRKSVENPIKDAEINILGSLNLLENSKEFKVKKIIFASTGGAIYGEAKIIPTPESYPAMPISPYGIAKLTIEKYLHYYYRIFGLPFICLRLANVYGPRQNAKGEAGVIAIFTNKMILKEQPIINGPGWQTRDFIFVDDVVEANILAFKKKKIGVFNIGTGKETNINTIFSELRNLIGFHSQKIHQAAIPGEQKRSCLNFQKFKKEFGWQSKISLAEGLKKTIQWENIFESKNKNRLK